MSGRLATPAWEIRGLGDLAGDGKTDIVWRHQTSGMVYLWPMDGSAPLSETYVATVDPAYDIVGTGDFDGDGKADLLWRHATLGEVWVWLMDGAAPQSRGLLGDRGPGVRDQGCGRPGWRRQSGHRVAPRDGGRGVGLADGRHDPSLGHSWVGTVPDVGL